MGDLKVIIKLLEEINDRLERLENNKNGITGTKVNSASRATRIRVKPIIRMIGIR